MHTQTKAADVARYRLRCRQHQRDDDRRNHLQACRKCGCTEHAACPGGCAWVEYDLCSRCVFTMITFDVLGLPAPQGSKAAFVNPKTGKAVIKDSGGAGLKAWRNAVSSAARTMAEQHGCIEGALQLIVLFRFPMPVSRSKTDRLAGCIWRTTTPDSSKVLRSLEDGLVDGGLIADDRYIVEHLIRKVEILNSWTGATISVGRINRAPSISMEMPVELELFGEPA